MKIGIVNTGGDAQGLNAVIASAVKYGNRLGHEFIGFKRGWEGILDLDYMQLNHKSVRGISHLGGTILRTTNKGRFAGKKGAGEVNKIPDEILELAKKNLEELNIDVLIEIGGDAGLAAAQQLVEKGVKVVAAPKTIDNDLKSTDKTFGFGTAVDIVVEALDRIHTTATSHDRVILVETMGRHAGWIALHAGLAGGADAILLPEIDFSYEKLIRFLRDRKTGGYRSTIVVVAEGAKAKDEALVANDANKPEVQLGGVSFEIMRRIEELAPSEFEIRNTVLGHIQRGGSPNAEDRIISKIYGTATIDAIEQQKFGHMVALIGGKVTTVTIKEAVEELNFVSKDSAVFQSAKKIGIFMGE